jgi:hypothetical protein
MRINPTQSYRESESEEPRNAAYPNYASDIVDNTVSVILFIIFTNLVCNYII